MKPELSRLEFSIADGIATVSLNRADKLNAIDMQMFKELDELSKHLRKEKGLRVVIVKGNGNDFCSGIDVKSVLANASNARKLLFKWLPGLPNLAQRVSVNWRKLNVPVIMVLHGRCWGGGMQIALGGDFRIAAPNTGMAIMENKWGLIPDMGGTLALRETIAVDHAMELAMTAKEVDAQTAHHMGLITHISEDPLEHAKELAEELINRNPDTIAHIKRNYQKAWHKNDSTLLADETLSQIRIITGKNQKVAIARETKDPQRQWKLN